MFLELMLNVSCPALSDDTLRDISAELLNTVHMFSVLSLRYKKEDNPEPFFFGFLCTAAMLWISDIVCGLKRPIIEQAQCYIWKA